MNDKYEGIGDKIKVECETPQEFEARMGEVFKELAQYIIGTYFNLSNMETRNWIDLPDTAEDFYNWFDVKHAKTAMMDPVSCLSSFQARMKKLVVTCFLAPQIPAKDVTSVNDIHGATVNSIIHSSMCCGNEHRSWAFELDQIYQRYTEVVLRAAMLKVRSEMMVSIRKTPGAKKGNHCVPGSCAQFQFSVTYVQKFQTKWPYEVFAEANAFHTQLLRNWLENQGHPEGVLPEMTGGVVATINDLFPHNLIQFEVDIPEQVITLDPKFSEREDVYRRIAERYGGLLSNVRKAKGVGEAAPSLEEPESVDVKPLKRALTAESAQVKPKRAKLNEGEVPDNSYEFCDVASLGVLEHEEAGKSKPRITSDRVTGANVVVEQPKASKASKGEGPEKRNTRFALLNIEGEDWRGDLEDTHHAHEFFVVNSFKIRLCETCVSFGRIHQ